MLEDRGIIVYRQESFDQFGSFKRIRTRHIQMLSSYSGDFYTTSFVDLRDCCGIQTFKSSPLSLLPSAVPRQ